MAGSWVTITTARPHSPATWRSSAAISREARVSRLPVGSSASTSLGSATRARASETRCCWPPERLIRLVGQPLPQADALQPGLGLGLRPGSGHAVELQRQRGVLHGGEHAKQVVELEDEADLTAAQAGERVVAELAQRLTLHQHLAFGRQVKPAQQVQQSGLAAAGGAHNGHELADVDGEVDVVERHHRGFAAPVDFGQIAGLYNQEPSAYQLQRRTAAPPRPQATGHISSGRRKLYYPGQLRASGRCRDPAGDRRRA